MQIKHFIILISLIWSQQVLGQEELSSYFLENSGTSLYLNPAKTQDAVFSWALPSIYYVQGTSGPRAADFLKGSIFSLKDIESKLKKNNSFLNGFQSSFYGFYLNQENFSLNFGQNLRYFSQIDYNDKLFDLLINGNAQYIGETVQIGPSANINFYNEFYIGGGMKFQGLQLGLNFKYLNGYANFQTPKHEFSLYTHDEIYQLRFNTEYHINTNMTLDSLDFGSTSSQLIKNLWSNNGWAFDLGLKADIYDKFTISASLLDMGYIHWKNGATQIKSEGSFEFNGLDFNQLLTDSLDFIQLDSLANIVNFTATDENYKSALPVQFYLGLQYYPTEEWEVNALFYNYYSINKSNPAFRLGAKYKPSDYFHTSFSYTWNTFSNFNLGAGAEVNLKWFHLFLTMDNIIDIFRPYSGKYFNIRTGIVIDLFAG